MTLGFFFPLSKGAATSFKPIYKRHGQQQFFSFFFKLAQFLSNLISVVDNDGF
jgi:hypothetical protein